jgi:hypothetical protein
MITIGYFHVSSLPRLLAEPTSQPASLRSNPPALSAEDLMGDGRRTDRTPAVLRPDQAIERPCARASNSMHGRRRGRRWLSRTRCPVLLAWRSRRAQIGQTATCPNRGAHQYLRRAEKSWSGRQGTRDPSALGDLSRWSRSRRLRGLDPCGRDPALSQRLRLMSVTAATA